MNQVNPALEYTSSSISKYWNMLNLSNDISQKQQANISFSNLKQKCSNYLLPSIELFESSNNIQDKFISSLLIYQYIKENYDKLLKDEALFNKLKDFLINKTLVAFSNEKDLLENPNINLIVERICFSISYMVMFGCCLFWPDAVEQMLNFGKQTIVHTYLITVIFGKCYDELSNIFISKKVEDAIKKKFVEKSDDFKSFINTILSSYNNITNKLYNKTIYLAKNLIFFEVNTFHIPALLKIILENLNISNIDSISQLFEKCIGNSKYKKLEDELGSVPLDKYHEKMDKTELSSITLIIEYIYNYVNNNNNNKYEKDLLFGLGKAFSDITENFIYLIFMKDSLSQKMLKLFYFFISNKSRVISQLFFEPLLIMKNFINACEKFNNYNKDEKVEFSKFLIKICGNIEENCRFKKIENQDILLKGDNIKVNNNKEENKNNEENIDEIDEITINEYRNYAEDAFFNIFLVFAVNFQKDGIDFFFSKYY